MCIRVHGRALALLALLAVLNAVIYGFAFTGPYNLIDWQAPPYRSLDSLIGRDGRTLAYVRLAGAFVALGGLYGLGWRLARLLRGPAAWALVAGGAVISAAALLLMYPIGAADAFSNIMYGRIISRYGANPFFDLGADFAADPFSAYMAWKHEPTPYGPLCSLLYAAAGLLAGDGVVANVLAIKLLNALFLAGSIALVAATLQEHAPEWALPGALALAWNPIVLYETIGNGHNDILMVFWVLAAVWSMARRRYTLAVLAITAGALIKIVPALLLPAVALIALRRIERPRARVRFILGAAALSLALTALAYLPFWRGLETLTFLQRRNLFTASLPAVLQAWLAPRLGDEQAARLVGYSAWALAALFALRQALRARPDASWQAFPRAALSILLFYLLFVCAWFKEWYTLWPLALAAAIPSGRALALAALFGYSSMAQALIVWPFWVGPGAPHPIVIELRLMLAAMGLPWALLAPQALRRWIRTRRRVPAEA